MFTPDTAHHETAETNQALIERGYEAFSRGDLRTVFELFAPDIFWHVPGRGPLSGDRRGLTSVLALFQRVDELSRGTFRVTVEEVLAKGDRVVVLVTATARRHGHQWASPQVHVWTIEDGQATVFWQFQGDQQAEDEFWGGL